jgi:hypothetical protein
MSTRILFNLDFNAVDGGGNSFVKYRAGESYEVTEETTRLVASGIAEPVDVPEIPAPADKPAMATTAASE